jgi:hypothetical protein
MADNAFPRNGMQCRFSFQFVTQTAVNVVAAKSKFTPGHSDRFLTAGNGDISLYCTIFCWRTLLTPNDWA